MKNIHIAALLTLSAFPASAATTFSFEEGDLRQDGALVGAGASYTGTVDGSVGDNNNTTTLASLNVDRLGNQFQSPSNANVGTNGRQWNGLFSYDITQLANYITANPTFTVSAASFQLFSPGGSASLTTTLTLYRTSPFTGSSTWANLNSGTLTANPGGVAGGGSKESAALATTTSRINTNPGDLNFGTSANFVDAVNHALANGNILYLMVQGSYGNVDSFSNFTNNAGTIDSRPELNITLVPEPSTALLGALGALALLRRRR